MGVASGLVASGAAVNLAGAICFLAKASIAGGILLLIGSAGIVAGTGWQVCRLGTCTVRQCGCRPMGPITVASVSVPCGFGIGGLLFVLGSSLFLAPTFHSEHDVSSRFRAVVTLWLVGACFFVWGSIALTYVYLWAVPPRYPHTVDRVAA